MAYTVSVTKTKINEVDSLFEVTETDTTGGADGDEFTISVENTGRIFRYKSNITSGTGTIDPIIASTTNTKTGVDVIMENDSASTDIDLQPNGPVLFYSSSGLIYINNYASTSGLNISTKIFIRDTWGL